MFVESSDDEQIIERVAALDVGKAEIVCCIRLPAADRGRRVQEVSTHSTMVTSLCELANRLVGLGIERVVMEATSDYLHHLGTSADQAGLARLNDRGRTGGERRLDLGD